MPTWELIDDGSLIKELYPYSAKVSKLGNKYRAELLANTTDSGYPIKPLCKSRLYKSLIEAKMGALLLALENSNQIARQYEDLIRTINADLDAVK